MLDGMLPAISGILLAGGRSTRFGTNKLDVPFSGRPLAHYALEALALAVEELVIVVGPDQPTLALPDGLPVPARFARDPVAYNGPLVGLLAGLEECRAPRAIALAADMPSVSPVLLSRLVDRLARRDLDAVVLRDGDVARPLPMAVRVSTTVRAARGLRDAGEGSLVALLAIVRTLALDEPAWRDIDPTGEWRRDVDRREDLPSASS